MDENAATCPAPGAYSGITYESYAGWEAMNAGLLVELAESPAAFQWRRDHPLEDSDTLRMGRAMHSAILEPAAFAEEYAIGPCDDRRKKEWKAWAALDVPEGKTILTARQGAACQAARRALLSRKNPRALLEAAGKAEVSICWHDKTGRPCKGRIDRVVDTPNGPVLLELKTRGGPIDRPAIAREIAARYWHLKAAWYLDGYKAATGEEPSGFYFLVVRNVDPFPSAVYPLVREALDVGRKEYRSLLSILEACENSGQWPDPSDTILPIGLPAWYEPLTER